MSRLKITETVLRDGHQSLIATRLKTSEMIPILEIMDKVGYNALEMWGGATFDSCIRYLNEDPWDRLRTIRKHVKDTKLQMLLRGQNLLGYKHYADDLVQEFVKKSVYNGIDIIRIFDALNDTRNIRVALEATKKEKAHAQAAISFTLSPVHTINTFVDLAKEFESMGADSICIKDMAGLLSPYDAFDLISEMKKNIKLPIELHTHATSGLADMMYMKAVEAGVDIIDTAISPFSNGTSQPPTEAFVATFKNTKYDTGLDLEKLNQVAEYFKPIAAQYMKEGILDPVLLGVDINTLIYQVPGGMLSNLVSQLKAQNASDKLDAVLREVPRVREDMGYPPLVTPTSQIIGTQAVFNVLSGERYKMVSKEVKNYVKGMYGKSTIPMKQEMIEKIIGNEVVITQRPADLIEPELEKVKKEAARYVEQDEDVLTYAMFPQVAENFFKQREIKNLGIDSSLLNEEDKTYPV
jgi:oxaloacetate decarboxylase alpha subunit